jgi:hypothetical protein
VFRFFFKLIIIGIVVVSVYTLIFARHGKFPQITEFVTKVQSAINQRSLTPLALKDSDFSGLGNKLSDSLDSLVTHSGSASPVILGVKITNDSISALVDIIQKLPPDQTNQLKEFLCSPATPSAQ